MGTDFLRLPFYKEIGDAKTVLLAGAGGGYDVFCGLPLYFGLRAAGKTVHLANLSFTSLGSSTARPIGPSLFEVTHRSEGSVRYFPELHLARWFREKRREEVPVYGIERDGAKVVTAAYARLVDRLGGVDAVVLVDGGTDSLMRGDEPGLGTPQEDVASLCAVDALDGVATKLLVCLGFGVDTFHGVCHAYFLEAVAELAAQGAFLGAWSLTNDMPEVALYREALEFTHRDMFNNPSIVSSSVLAAVEGRFGDYHPTYRTGGNELFINPLMSLYWAFQLAPVVRRCEYIDSIRETATYAELNQRIAEFRAAHHAERREWKSLPM